MRTLLTGFEPFGNRKINNSWDVARHFEGMENIDVVRVPVSFGRAPKVVIDALKCKKYDLILMLGETGVTKDKIRLERVALNFMDSSIADNDGIVADEEELISGAVSAYFTSFPIKLVAGKLVKKGYKVKVTNSAGTFVCNSLYYHILRHLEENGGHTAALFIHLPAETTILSIEEMKDTISSILSCFNKNRE